MPELDFMILCDRVHLDRGKLYMLGAGIDQIIARELPTAQDVGLALRLHVTIAELGRTHPMEVIFQAEDGERFLEISGEFTAERPSSYLAGSPIGVGLSVDMRLPLPREGNYSIVLVVSGREMKAIPLRVVRARSPKKRAG